MSLAQVGQSTAIVYGNGARAQKAEAKDIGRSGIRDDLRDTPNNANNGLMILREKEQNRERLQLDRALPTFQDTVTLSQKTG